MRKRSSARCPPYRVTRNTHIQIDQPRNLPRTQINISADDIFAAPRPTHILMPIQMPQQRQLSQTPPRQDDLVKHPGQELDGDLFPRYRVFGRDDQPVRPLT